MRLSLAFFVLPFALAVACGGSQSGDAAAPSSTATPSDVPFDELSPSERKQYMQAVVVPAMTKLFQASPEPEHFTKVTCVTCHGPGAKNGNFEMPSEALPKLKSFEDAMAEHPEMTQYMAERVTPEMAKLLKEEPYNPETGKGFGCFGCHMKAE